MRSSNGTDSARLRKLSRPYANSGQTPLLLEEPRFLLSSLPARTFLSSTPSVSRLSALAHPDSLRGFSSCSPRPATRPRGLSHTPPTPGAHVTPPQYRCTSPPSSPMEHVFANAGDIIVGNFTQNIESEITSAIGIDSAAYATAINKWLDDTTAIVNNDLFGFANTAADAVPCNSTRASRTVSTPRSMAPRLLPRHRILALRRGRQGFRARVFGLEGGLTNKPQLAPSARRAGNVSEVANPVSAAAMGNGTAAGESGIMSRAFESYRDVLKSKVYMFSVFLCACPSQRHRHRDL